MHFQDIKIILINKPYDPYGATVSKPLKPASDLFAHVPRLIPYISKLMVVFPII